MKARLLIAVVAVLGYAILDATPANGEDRHFNPSGYTGTGDWDEITNWCDTCDNRENCRPGVPTEAESVQICNGKTASVRDDTAEARYVTFESTASGAIHIDPPGNGNAVLTLGDGTNETSVLSGTIVRILLEDGGDYYARLTFYASEEHTFTGTGIIRGEDDDAQIYIQTDDTDKMTSQVIIDGQLQFLGAGDFVNNGLVRANVSGTLDIAMHPTNASVTDDAADRWEVSDNSGAKLRFLWDDDVTAFLGNFTVSNGQLIAGDRADDIDVINVATSGNLTQTGGEIVVGLNDSFVFSE